jgi:hypothetical protein
MRWRKLGRIFEAMGQRPWMVSHASTPAVDVVDGGVRVYFTSRDSENRSHIGCFDVNPRDPLRTVRLHDHPVIGPGSLGHFDDSGTSMGCIVPTAEGTRLYYVGWNLCVTVPWRNSIGLAVGGSGSGFAKTSPAPVVDRSVVDPYSLSYPWILREGGVWKMWYGSNLTWGGTPEDMVHVIKYAESEDGICWRRDGSIAIDAATPEEYALSRPCVVHADGIYRMWYCHRGPHYRIGYAESRDGLKWERRDGEAGIEPSESGWDAEMIAYPCVFDFDDDRYMLYNGNGYGRTGIGLAILERE